MQGKQLEAERSGAERSRESRQLGEEDVERVSAQLSIVSFPCSTIWLKPSPGSHSPSFTRHGRFWFALRHLNFGDGYCLMAPGSFGNRGLLHVVEEIGKGPQIMDI